MALLNETNEQYYLGPDGIQNSGDESYGNYQFITLNDIINNFIISYVGEDKIISKIKRTDVAFHAQRAIQEFSYDLFKSFKSQESEIPPTLQIPLPQDYVNYTKITWLDESGIERIIYPTRNTSNPLPLLQDNDYEYLFDGAGELLAGSESETWKKFKAATLSDEDSDSNIEDIENDNGLMQLKGQRFGITPEYAQGNGVFFIDPLKGKIFFDSSLSGKIITIKYISDGLGTNEEAIVHKFAEEAVYKKIAHSILSTRANTQEYIIDRFKREAAAARRNAKLRLSNLKIEELALIMRNKSKQLKH